MTTRRRAAAVVVTVALLAAGTAAPAAGTASPAAGTATLTVADSPTYISSDITANTTLTTENGPYVVTGDVTINSGATLTIDPGTTVQVAEKTTLTVRGSLHANGTTAAPVTITTGRPSPSAGAWDTIRYEGSADSTLSLRNTTLEYANSGLTLASDDGTVSVTDSVLQSHVRAGITTADIARAPTLSVTDSRIVKTQYAGIDLETDDNDPYLEAARDLKIRGTTFQNTGTYGMLVRAKRVADVTVTDTSIRGFKTAGIAVDTGPKTTSTPSQQTQHIRNTRITDTNISNNRGAGITLASAHASDILLARNNVHDVGANGIQLLRAFSIDDVTVASNTVTNTTTGVYIDHRRLDGPHQDFSVDVTGNTLQENAEYGLRVDTDHASVTDFNLRKNTFAANGYDGARVTMPSIDNTVIADNVARDNAGTGVEVTGFSATNISVTGNRLDGNQQEGVLLAVAGSMGDVTVTENRALDNTDTGIAVTHNVASTQIRLTNNTVAANDLGIRVGGPTSTLLANNSIVFNTRGAGAAPGSSNRATGVLVQNAQSNTTLRHNDIEGHITGLRTQTSGTVQVSNNYWGAESGPYHASINPNGAGDAIETGNGTVEVVPFSTSRFGPEYQRPQPRLVANQTTITPGESVTFSARSSTDDGQITTYRYTVQNTAIDSQSDPTLTRSFSKTGTHEIAVSLVDEMGVESVTAASVTITVKPSQQPTTTTTATTTTTTPTTTEPTTSEPPTQDSGGGEGGVMEGLQTIWGALGAGFYLIGLLLGVNGVYRSLNDRRPPTRGRNVHVLVGVAAVVWIIGGLLGTPGLLLVGVGGIVLWTALTVGLYVVATR